MALFGASPASAAGLDIGDLAPPFELQGSDGKVHRLADYRVPGGGRRVVSESLHRWLNGGVQVAP